MSIRGCGLDQCIFLLAFCAAIHSKIRQRKIFWKNIFFAKAIRWKYFHSNIKRHPIWFSKSSTADCVYILSFCRYSTVKLEWMYRTSTHAGWNPIIWILNRQLSKRNRQKTSEAKDIHSTISTVYWTSRTFLITGCFDPGSNGAGWKCHPRLFFEFSAKCLSVPDYIARHIKECKI